MLTKFGGKVAHGPRKKSVRFGGNPESGSGYVTVTVSEGLG